MREVEQMRASLQGLLKVMFKHAEVKAVLSSQEPSFDLHFCVPLQLERCDLIDPAMVAEVLLKIGDSLGFSRICRQQQEIDILEERINSLQEQNQELKRYKDFYDMSRR